MITKEAIYNSLQNSIDNGYFENYKHFNYSQMEEVAEDLIGCDCMFDDEDYSFDFVLNVVTEFFKDKNEQ